MELKTLVLFCEVEKTKNISEVASIFNLSQPSVTRQFKLLQEELGQDLYFRHKIRFNDAIEMNTMETQKIYYFFDTCGTNY